MPNVSTLTLEGCGEVLFFDRTSQGLDIPRPLRELELRSCNRYMKPKTLEAAIQSLKSTGAWDMLERMVIRGCESLDETSALAAVGEERLRFLVQ